MATVNEQIVTGRKFRKLIDEATKLWQRISFWTKASDVEFDDGNDAETKVGAIDGITDSLTATSSNIALSAKAGNDLRNQISELNTGTGLKLLWENPSPTAAFGAQNITLPDGDYSLLLLIYMIGGMYNSEIFPRNTGTYINYATAYESKGGYSIVTRRFQHVSNNTYSVSGTTQAYGNDTVTGVSYPNSDIVPYRIYGI